MPGGIGGSWHWMLNNTCSSENDGGIQVFFHFGNNAVPGLICI